jgi:hypothetical protein
MPNRIIKESICTSDSIDRLSIDAERLFYRLIVNCDDYGVLDARLAIIKSKCFPLKSNDITDCQLISWLSELESQEMIFFYENSDRQYLKMASWEKHQQIRAKRPKYPLPGDEKSNRISFDIMCNQEKSNVTVIQSNPIRNPIQSESNPNPPIAPNGGDDVLKETKSDERFKAFWKAYPKKVGKGAAEKSFQKYKPDDYLLGKMLKAINAQKKTDQWKKDGGQFIPNPSTWLNQKRWEDETTSQNDSWGGIQRL